jgi:hypothetical protein
MSLQSRMAEIQTRRNSAAARPADYWTVPTRFSLKPRWADQSPDSTFYHPFQVLKRSPLFIPHYKQGERKEANFTAKEPRNDRFRCCLPRTRYSLPTTRCCLPELGVVCRNLVHHLFEANQADCLEAGSSETSLPEVSIRFPKQTNGCGSKSVPQKLRIQSPQLSLSRVPTR